jgi:ABC-type uncharacterized transport system permease subunit
VRVLRAAAAVTVALLVSSLVLVAVGANPIVALAALARGAAGDRFAIGDTLVKACPLVLTGLAVAIAFRSGTWNIGAEGQLLVGALAAAAVARAASDAPAPFPLVAALAAGAAAGALWAALAAVLRVTRNVNEVISTLMLNFVALRLVGWAVHGPLMEAGGRYPQSEAIPGAAMLPRLLGRVHAGVLLAAVFALLAWVLLFRTTRGFRWRAIGDNHRAAVVAGFHPRRELVAVMLVSGASAGVAGAVELLGVTGRLFEQFSGGQGYTAIAVALLARLHPAGVLLAALFFGGLAAGSGAMQRSAGVSAVLTAVIQGVTILTLLALEAPRISGAWRRVARSRSEP